MEKYDLYFDFGVFHKPECKKYVAVTNAFQKFVIFHVSYYHKHTASYINEWWYLVFKKANCQVQVFYFCGQENVTNLIKSPWNNLHTS